MYTIQSTTNWYGKLLVSYYGTFATIGDADRARANIVNHAPKTGAHYAAVLITKHTATPKPLHPSYL
jgi:hypothetical protein